jgi:hypothetical protein
MELDLEAVSRVFDEVLNGRMSRERADRWAYAVVREEETGVVKYSPPRERERIWAGVMYLYGIDAMKGPNAYLHSGDDIRQAMIATVGGVGDPTTIENLPAIEHPPQYLGADSAPL